MATNYNGSYFNNVQVMSERCFSITGDNGMCITFQETHLIEAIRALINVEITECSNEIEARSLAYRTYTSRFLMRNNAYGVPPELPVSLPAELLWIDKNYKDRELNLKSNINHIH